MNKKRMLIILFLALLALLPAMDFADPPSASNAPLLPCEDLLAAISGSPEDCQPHISSAVLMLTEEGLRQIAARKSIAGISTSPTYRKP